MPPTDRSPYRFVAYGFLAVIVMLGAIPGYLVLAPAWRPLAMRLVCALIVVAGCMRMVAVVRRSIEDDPPSPLDAPPPAPRRPALDDRFLRLRDDLVFSRGSWRYFEVFLQPRLRALGGTDLPAPAERRRFRRGAGPSLNDLARVITEIEQRG